MRTSNARFLLLDGQQRSLAIVLGMRGDSEEARLWLDMAPGMGIPRKEFVVVVCANAQPWGYRPQDDRHISASDRRSARAQFERLHNNYKECLDHELPLSQTWPALANLPVPFAEYWRFYEDCKQRGGSDTFNSDWQDLLPQVKRDAWKQVWPETKRIWGALENLNRMAVPLLELNISDSESDISLHTPEDEPDPIELMFERVNAGGVVLAGEEMIFSMMSAKWPDTHNLVLAIHQSVGGLLPTSPGEPKASCCCMARRAPARPRLLITLHRQWTGRSS